MEKTHKTTSRKPNNPYTPEDLIIKALRATKGNFSYAAKQLGMDRSSLSHRVNESPRLRAIADECIQERLDVAESMLTELNEEKDLGSLCFVLKTLGRSRGYGNDPEDKKINVEALRLVTESVARMMARPPPTQTIEQSTSESPSDHTAS